MKTCIVCNKEFKKLESNKKQQCKSCYNKEWKRNNKEKVATSTKKWLKSEKGTTFLKKSYQDNKEKIKKQWEEWYEQNKEKRTKYMQNYQKQRYNSDPLYKLTNNLRTRFKHAINGLMKYESVLELTGCTLEELKAHLESQFLEGMTWENHGLHGWHIDHIKPCSSFDLTDLEQQKLCFHYTNLQPLWAADNLKKSDKYE